MDADSFREPPFAGDETDLRLGILERTAVSWRGSAAGWTPLVCAPRRRRGTPSTGPRTRTGSGARRPRDTPEELFALWQEAVERSRANLAEALTRGDLSQLVQVAGLDGEPVNLRRIVVDMIDEYARHNGQADLIRESVDGRVGEDPPRRLAIEFVTEASKMVRGVHGSARADRGGRFHRAARGTCMATWYSND